MFKIIGDEVTFEGWPICALRADIPATVRDRLDAALEGWVEDTVPLQEYTDMERDAKYWEAKARAYAAILMVDPDDD